MTEPSRSAPLVRLLATVLLLVATHPAPAAELQSDPGIDKLFARFTSSTPGCAVAAERNGETVLSRAYGMADLEHGVPLSSKSMFNLASVSKQFTAMSILLLAESGKLSLDDSIRRYVPELPRYADAITLRHLLHHTSGLRDYLGLGALSVLSFNTPVNDEMALKVIARQQALNFPVGEQFSYSNTGYFLLSQVAKSVSGGTLNDVAHEAIFAPLV